MFVTNLDLRDYESKDDFWVVLDDLGWRTPTEWIVVPRGFITDLASIPKPLRNLFDPNGKSRKPAVLHDWIYRTHEFTKAQCDQLLYDALIACGESKVVAWMYKAGVAIGGASAYNDHPMGVQPYDFASPDFYAAWKAAA